MIANKKNGEFIGFDISLMEEICRRLNATCTFQGVYFDQLFDLVSSGEVDLAIAAIIITPERSEKFLFSLPYKESHLQYIVRYQSPLQSIEDLQGKTIGVYLNSPAQNFVLQQFANTVQFQTYRTSAQMFDALYHQKIDAIIINPPQAMYWMSNNSGIYRLLGKKYPIGEGYGIMTQLGRNDLMAQINNILNSIENDGTYLNIYNSFFSE
ncbi:transporter substrate-binding domain-containing protein [Legionella cardiaca]|uniref:Transporter substrate-binding domain-containing protein n=1 Tax=Legionella cardiaca TaxID=1071983 RepID=A0ABY8AWR5_9GAMM|nr:transporter substrate-binding domain-containing protein [Legionella cardiaca]WED43866.1 transporter substrate-binding domain-containing protein [Legionella cardiaca]